MAHYVNVYRPFHGCFGASCSDLWAEDAGPVLSPAPSGADLSVPSSTPATPGAAAPSYTPSFGHVLPWWAWLALGILVTYAALED